MTLLVIVTTVLRYRAACDQSKQALLEEEKKKKEEEAEEAKRVDQRTRKHLHEQLAEQAQLEMAQIAEQETAIPLTTEVV